MSYKSKYPDSYERGKRMGREAIAGFSPDLLADQIKTYFKTSQDIRHRLLTNTFSSGNPLTEEGRTAIERNAALFEGILSCFD